MKSTAQEVNELFLESIDTLKTLSQEMIDIMTEYIKDEGKMFFEKNVCIRSDFENAILIVEVRGLEVIDDNLMFISETNGAKQVADFESLLKLFNAFRKVVNHKEKKAA